MESFAQAPEFRKAIQEILKEQLGKEKNSFTQRSHKEVASTMVNRPPMDRDTVMASKAANAAKGGIRAWLLPEINEIKGELRTMNVRIDDLDKRLSSKVEEMDKRLSSKVEEMDKRLSSKIDDLDKRLDIVQRLSVLEAKVKEIRQ